MNYPPIPKCLWQSLRFFDADDSERIAKMFPTRVGTYMGAAEFYAPETDMTYVREKVEHLGTKYKPNWSLSDFQ